MKKVIFASAVLVISSSAFAGPAEDTATAALHLLLNNSSRVALQGDVSPSESVNSILANDLSMGPNYPATVANSCTKSTDGSKLSCALIIDVTPADSTGEPSSETSISYTVKRDQSGAYSNLQKIVQVGRGD